jgi:hypothetical protein
MSVGLRPYRRLDHRAAGSSCLQGELRHGTALTIPLRQGRALAEMEQGKQIGAARDLLNSRLVFAKSQAPTVAACAIFLNGLFTGHVLGSDFLPLSSALGGPRKAPRLPSSGAFLIEFAVCSPLPAVRWPVSELVLYQPNSGLWAGRAIGRTVPGRVAAPVVLRPLTASARICGLRLPTIMETGHDRGRSAPAGPDRALISY